MPADDKVIIFIIIFPRYMYWAFVFVLWFYSPVNPGHVESGQFT